MSTSEKNIHLGDGWMAAMYRHWDFPSDVIEAWDSLAFKHGDAGIFISYGWFENWWKAFGKAGELFVVVLAKNGVIAGIFPCKIGDPRKSFQEITFLTNDHTYSNDFIIDRTCGPTVLTQFMRVLKNTSPDAQLFVDYLSASGEGFHAFTDELHQNRLPFQSYSQYWAPWLSVTGDIETYRKALPQKKKSDLQRRRKKAEQAGALNLEIIRQSAALDSILDTIFEVEYKSWKGRDGTAIKCISEVEQFYRGIAHLAMSGNNLYIFILNMGDRAIAMNLCIATGRTLFCLKNGYDESFKNLSPGGLLHWEMFNYLFQSPDLTAYNFMGACEPWKMEWTNETNNYGWIRVYPKTLKGKGQYIMRYGWKNFLRRFETVQRITTYIGKKSERHAV